MNTILNPLQRLEGEQRGRFASVLTFVEKNHRGVASGRILPHLVIPGILGPGTTRLHAPELTRHKHPNLGVEPATVGILFANTSLHSQECLSWRAMLKTDVNLLHDDDVEAIHGHEEQRLPPEKRNNTHKKTHQRHHASAFDSRHSEEILKTKLILEEKYSIKISVHMMALLCAASQSLKCNFLKIRNRQLR